MKYLLAILFLASGFQVHAQIEVNLDIKRRLWVRHEPMEANVSITNNSGHELLLEDLEGRPWFSFEVMKDGNTPVAPFDADYHLDPLLLPAGQTMKRSVNLTNLYPMNSYATYHIKAVIYLPEAKKYFSSNLVKTEITDGKKIWSQTVGVPDGQEGAGSLRQYTLMTFQQGDKGLTVYVRVEDDETHSILATYPVGRVVSGSTPTGVLGPDNTLHIFHMTAPNTYMLTKIGVDGDWQGQSTWISAEGRAAVRKKEDGTMVVVGAKREAVLTENDKPVPKLSDRPAVLPQ